MSSPLRLTLGAAARLVLAIVILETMAAAHPLAPALLELNESDGGRVDVMWKVGALTVPGSPLRPHFAPACRDASRPVTRAGTTEASVTTTWTMICGGGLSGRTIAIEGLDAAGTQSLLRAQMADGRMLQRVITAVEPAFTIPKPAAAADVMRHYLALGVEQMLTEGDHLFFLLGLFLLAAAPRPLAWAVAGFAAGHSVSLTLSVLGIAAVPAGPLNLAIALSVLALAIELSRHTTATVMRRFPWVVAAVFGLLHGFAFAGALRGAGLPAGETPLALGSFNVGLELGQLTFVASALLVWFGLRQLPFALPRWAPQLPIYAMGTLGVFWSLQRAVGLF